EKRGGASKKAAPETLGDVGLSPGGTPTVDKPDDSSSVPGDASPPPAGDDAEADAEDEKLIADIEGKLDRTTPVVSRKRVNEHRGALQRIAETAPEQLKARAAKILQEWPAK